MSKVETSMGDWPAPVFAALGDPTRLNLLDQLSQGQSRSIAALSSDGRMTRQAITKHLNVLEAAGLVGHAKVGRETLYNFRSEPLDEARAYLVAVSAQWDQRLARLKAMVEGD